MNTTEPENGSEREVESIPLPRFERVLRGFDPQAVTSFLKTVLGRLRDLEGQVTDLQAELEKTRKHGVSNTPGSASNPYELFSGHVADVVRAFDQDVERIKTQAEAEARRVVIEAKTRSEADARQIDERSREAKTQVDAMLEEARAEADRIRVDAQAKAEESKAKAARALEDARARATEFVSDLESRRAAVLADMRSLRDRVLEAAGKLDPVLGDQPAGDVTVAEGDVAVSEGRREPSELIGREG